MSSSKEAMYLESIEKVYEIFNTSPQGLTEEEAKKRLEIYGKNELTEKKRKSKIVIFLEQFKDFLVFVLIFAALISAFVGEVTESIIIWIIIIANAVLGFIQEYRAEAAIDALKEIGALKALVKRAGMKKEISSLEIVPGDIVYLESGDKVPADGRVIKDTNLYIEEAALTGESVPTEKASKILSVDAQKTIPVNDQKNMVFSSTIVTNGRGNYIVTKTGMDTEVGKIAELIQTQEEMETPLNKKLKKFGKQIGLIILGVCIVIFIIKILRQETILTAFIVSISLAVAAIPEGLPVVVTTTLALGVQRMSKRNAIIRKLPAIETLGSTTKICTDKTGTLTKNEMTVKQLYLNHERFFVSGEGYEPKGRVTDSENKEISPQENDVLKTHILAGYLCNNAFLMQDEKGKFIIEGDPTEGAFIVLGEKMGLQRKEIDKQYERIAEYFFDSTRKRMSVVVKNLETEKEHLYMKGAPEIVLNLCDRIYIDGKIRGLTEEDKIKILDANNDMAAQALRVLATAYDFCEEDTYECKPEEVEKDLIFIGLVGIIDPARPEAKSAIETSKRAGIDVKMITGDQAITAKAIAQELDIIEKENERIILGNEINDLSDEELLDSHVYARVAPEHKLRIVDALQKQGEIVAMTGDGINDAPALKKADIGVAMGITGTDVSKEASSMILADDNFATIVSAVEEGRGIFDNMKKFILFLISCNIAEILLIFVGILIDLPLPLIAIQILWINLMTDGLPALALSSDPYEPDIMSRKPRDPKKNIIDKRAFTSIIIRAMIITAISLVLYYIALEIYAPGWQTLPKDSPQLYLPRTFVFSTLLICELLNVYNTRSDRRSFFKVPVWSNKYLLIAVLISLTLNFVLIYTPPLANLFQLSPIPLIDWLIIIPLSFLTVVSEELIKWYWRTHKYND
ncbi:MAG: calcium-translocating P-type ATPase, SERCA-type [Promethearchaeota archaeon]|nr:MAG: calcium-translocating P-type ATPase, SERCA-type [Candidatus Lokiarchaeota archaeon]